MLNQFKNLMRVFPSNKLPIVNLKCESFCAMIINTQKSSSEDVGHWILLKLFTKNKVLVRCEVFDSLAGGRDGLNT